MEDELLADNKRKCRISEGCLYAIGSQAGYCLVKKPLEDDYGVDFTVSRIVKRNGKSCSLGDYLEIQLKALSNWRVVGNNISFRLPTRALNNMIMRNIVGTPKLILAVMLLPRAGLPATITQNAISIIFKHSVFWYNTDEVNMYENENSSLEVLIPATQILDANSFRFIVDTYALRAR